jgi:hypothetical protein
MSGKGCGIQQSFHPPHPPPQPGNLCDRFMGGTVWHWCGSVSSVLVILGGGGEVSHSYALQELPPEGSITLLHSAGTPTRGEDSHFYTLQALPP